VRVKFPREEGKDVGGRVDEEEFIDLGISIVGVADGRVGDRE
jgi:hypothetical protein